MELFTCVCIIFQLFRIIFANRTVKYNDQGSWEVVPRQMECYLYETTLIENITCKYKRLSRLRASYSLDVYIKPGVLIKDIIVKGTAFRKGTNLEYRAYGPQEVTVDVCRLLAGTWTSWAADLIMKELKNMGNLFQSCPFSGHVYIHDLRSTENTYAVLKILPDGEYYYEGAAYLKINGKEKLIMKTKTFLDVVGKGLFKF